MTAHSVLSRVLTHPKLTELRPDLSRGRDAGANNSESSEHNGSSTGSCQAGAAASWRSGTKPRKCPHLKRSRGKPARSPFPPRALAPESVLQARSPAPHSEEAPPYRQLGRLSPPLPQRTGERTLNSKFFTHHKKRIFAEGFYRKMSAKTQNF